MNKWFNVTEKPLKEPCLIVYKNSYLNNKLIVGCTDAFVVVNDNSVVDASGGTHEVVCWMPYPKLPKITN